MEAPERHIKLDSFKIGGLSLANVEEFADVPHVLQRIIVRGPEHRAEREKGLIELEIGRHSYFVAADDLLEAVRAARHE